MPLSTNRKDYIVEKFCFSLAQFLKEYKSNASDLKTQKSIFRKVTSMIRNELARLFDEQASNEEIRDLAARLVEKVKYFDGMKYAQKTLLISNLIKEARLLPYEKANFVKIPTKLFFDWFNFCVDKKLSRYEGNILLAILLANHQQSGISNQQSIIRISGKSPKTVRRHIDRFELGGWIHKNKMEGYTEIKLDEDIYFRRTDSLSKYDHGRIRDAFFNQKDYLANFNDFDFASYLPARPKIESNPLISYGLESIIIHEKLCIPELLMLSLLKPEELRKWPGSIISRKGKAIDDLEEAMLSKLQSVFNPKIISTDKHFLQIEKVIPILRYMGLRSYQVDYARLQDKFDYYSTLQGVESRNLKRWLRNEVPTDSEENWDYKYFVRCLKYKDPGSKWREKYADVTPQFVLNSVRQLLDNNGKVSLSLPPDWSRDDLKSLLAEIACGSSIKKLLDIPYFLQTLENFRRHISQTGKFSLSFHYSILNTTTHGNFLIDPSPQTIPKSLREIITARDGYQFLWIDISQMHLQVLYGLAKQHSKEEIQKHPDKDFFTRVGREIGVQRKNMKIALYAQLNGAGRKTIMQKAEMSPYKLKLFKDKLKEFPGYYEIMQLTSKHGKKYGITTPTPLGFKIPLYKKIRLSAGYLVAATANEIFREWILQMHEVGLSKYLVNAIHDEIILEVPISENLYEITQNAYDALKQGASNILPECELTVKAKAASAWHAQNATSIVI